METLDTLRTRIDAYSELLSAGHILNQAVLGLAFTNALPVDSPERAELWEQSLTELWQAQRNYSDTYIKVYPK